MHRVQPTAHAARAPSRIEKRLDAQARHCQNTQPWAKAVRPIVQLRTGTLPGGHMSAAHNSHFISGVPSPYLERCSGRRRLLAHPRRASVPTNRPWSEMGTLMSIRRDCAGAHTRGYPPALGFRLTIVTLCSPRRVHLKTRYSSDAIQIGDPLGFKRPPWRIIPQCTGDPTYSESPRLPVL